MVLEVNAEFIGAIIAAVAAVLAAAIPYFLTKQKELRMELKKTKLQKYDDLLLGLSQFFNKPDAENATKLVLAYNRSTSYATRPVLKACNDFLSAMKIEWKRRQALPGGKDHLNELVNSLESDDTREIASKIFYAIREDVDPEHVSRHLLSRREQPSIKEVFKIYLGKEV
jgi:hypothetical protein